MSLTVCPMLQSRRIEAPSDSMIADWYPSASLLDTYFVPLHQTHTDVRPLARRMLEQPPPGFRLLLGIRDAVMGRFGVKTSQQVRAAHGDNNRMDFFPLLLASSEEVILGEDDRHLDFRLSLKLQRNADGPDFLLATTAVRCHNRLGRYYIWVIKPFHQWVVRSHLARAMRVPAA